MPVVFERLAAQLREPLFRTSEEGYDPEDVRVFLDEAAARLAVLEARLAKAEARAGAAEKRLAGARRFARSRASREGVAPDAAVLDRVVIQGQERAAQVAAEAVAEAERLRQEAAARVAAAAAAGDVPELRAELDDQRSALRRQRDAAASSAADLDAVAVAMRAGRDEILAGLDRHLRELAAMPFPVLKRSEGGRP